MQVHRCRFVDWVPDAINALSFCPDGKRIAVARSTGNVEIWNTECKWFCQYTIYGNSNINIRNFLWVEVDDLMQTDSDDEGKQYRLICSGLDGKIFEVDFSKLAFKNESDSYGGSIWSMALQPKGSMLALACEDGSIRLFDISRNNITYMRGITGSDSRLLSICWCDNSLSDSNNYVFTGSSDGIIRKWNINSNRILNKIRVEKQRKFSTCIWSIVSLTEDICAFGDSAGHLQIWNLNLGVMLQTFSRHEADITSVVINDKKDQIYTAGIDGQVVLYQYLNTSMKATESNKKWVYSYTHRAHSHDITSLSLFTPVSTDDDTDSVNEHKSILVSGGLDTYLVRYNASNFKNERPSKCMSILNKDSVHIKKNYMLVQYTHDVHLYALGTKEESSSMSLPPVISNTVTSEGLPIYRQPLSQDYKHLVCLHLQDIGNIAGSDFYINEELNIIYIVMNTDINIKLYSYNLNTNTLVNITCPSVLEEYRYVSVSFMPSCPCLVALTDNGYLHIYDSIYTKIFDILLPKEILAINEHPFKGPYQLISVANDSSSLCLVDIYNRIIFVKLDFTQKSYSTYFLYSSSLPIISLKYMPDMNNIIITFSDNTISIYDCQNVTISKEYAYIFDQHLYIHDTMPSLIYGVITDYVPQQRLLFWGQNFIYKCDISKNLNNNTQNIITSQTKRSVNSENKQEASSNTITTSSNFIGQSKIIKEYEPIIYLSSNIISDRNDISKKSVSLCVLEREWLDIVSHLPPVFYKKRYGV